MIYETIIIILAIPLGFLIAHLTKEELEDGRKWFKFIIIISLITGFIGAYLRLYYIVWTCGFIAIISFISLIKSLNKKFLKRRI